LQTITGISLNQYDSNSNNTIALKTAIAQSFTAPTNISVSDVQSLIVSGANTRRNRRFLQTSSSSIFASYQIVTSSKYPSSAYSAQLSDSVSNGQFDTNLQTASQQLGTTSFENATSSAVSIGRILIKLLKFYVCVNDFWRLLQLRLLYLQPKLPLLFLPLAAVAMVWVPVPLLELRLVVSQSLF
jgi:hypothetical protein